MLGKGLEMPLFGSFGSLAVLHVWLILGTRENQSGKFKLPSTRAKTREFMT